MPTKKSISTKSIKTVKSRSVSGAKVVKKEKTGLLLKTIDRDGKTGEKQIDAWFLNGKPNPLLLAQSIRVFLSNQRSAQAKAKHRGEVRGTTKKLYAQKGTGRARHGTKKAPIFVGGGSAHGPTGGQNYQLTMPKKMAKRAFIAAMVDRYQQDRIRLCLDFDFEKTKLAAELINRVEEWQKVKKLSFIVTSQEKELIKTVRNLTRLDLFLADSLHPYQVIKNDWLLITQTAFNFLINKNAKSKN